MAEGDVVHVRISRAGRLRHGRIEALGRSGVQVMMDGHLWRLSPAWLTRVEDDRYGRACAVIPRRIPT